MVLSFFFPYGKSWNCLVLSSVTGRINSEVKKITITLKHYTPLVKWKMFDISDAQYWYIWIFLTFNVSSTRLADVLGGLLTVELRFYVSLTHGSFCGGTSFENILTENTNLQTEQSLLNLWVDVDLPKVNCDGLCFHIILLLCQCRYNSSCICMENIHAVWYIHPCVTRVWKIFRASYDLFFSKFRRKKIVSHISEGWSQNNDFKISQFIQINMKLLE